MPKKTARTVMKKKSKDDEMDCECGCGMSTKECSCCQKGGKKMCTCE